MHSGLAAVTAYRYNEWRFAYNIFNELLMIDVSFL